MKKIFLIVVLTIISGLLIAAENGVQPKKETLQKLLDERNKLVNKRHFDEANSVNKKIIYLYPDTNEAKGAMLGIAENYYRDEKYEEAIQEYRNILKNISDRKHMYFAIRRILLCYQNQEKNQEASEQIKTFIAIYPEFKKDLLIEMALIYGHEKKYSEMIDVYLNVVKFYPDDTQTAERVMQMVNSIPISVLEEREISKMVIELFAYIAKHSPKLDTKCYYTIGLIYENLQQYDNAIDFFKKTIESSNNTNFVITIQLKMAEIFKKTEKQSLSKQIYQEILFELNKQEPSPTLLTKISEIYRELEKYEEEIEILKKLIEIFPSAKLAGNAQYRVAAIYRFQLGKLNKAREEYEKFIDDYPDDLRINFCWKHIGGIYLKLKEYDKAIGVQKKLRLINPNDPSPKLMIKLIEDYYKKGITPSEEDIKKISAEQKRKNEN